MPVITPIKIVHATSNAQLDEVRNLIRAFVEWDHQTHQQDIELINEHFNPLTYEKELTGLPGEYAPPRGHLLLAYYDGKPAGCVALRGIDQQTCEMKRMFIYTNFHRKGIGRALATQLIDEARKTGYSFIKLDTSIRQQPAIELYQSLGFSFIDPYYELPEELKGWLVFMELKLK